MKTASNFSALVSICSCKKAKGILQVVIVDIREPFNMVPVTHPKNGSAPGWNLRTSDPVDF